MFKPFFPTARQVLFIFLLVLCSTLSAQTILTSELTTEDRDNVQIKGGGNLQIVKDASLWATFPSNDSHLHLRSFDLSEPNAYVGIRFQQSNQYDYIIRARQNGFHFLSSANFYEYAKVHARIMDQSDRSYKENISTLEQPLDLVMSLRGVRFSWKESGRADIGFIAQEVNEVLPEIVEGEEGDMSVAYSHITAVAVEAIKALKAENDDLKARLEALEAEVAELKGN